eukprot:Skav220872  [mRNA]  locus=scaffold1331:190340:196791:+ [translate_table: standard]
MLQTSPSKPHRSCQELWLEPLAPSAEAAVPSAAIDVAQSVDVFRQAIWHKQMEKAAAVGVKENWLGDDLRPDIAAECESWTSKQLSSQKLAPDSALAQLYRGFAAVVHSVTVNAEQVTVAKADGSFEALRVQIQDVWRQHMGEIGDSTSKATASSVDGLKAQDR